MGCEPSRYILKVGWAQQGRELPGRASVGFLGNRSAGLSEDAELAHRAGGAGGRPQTVGAAPHCGCSSAVLSTQLQLLKTC